MSASQSKRGIREFFKWGGIVIAEEIVRTQVPRYLSYVLLAVLVYATWEILESPYVRTVSEGAYLRLKPRHKMLSYIVVFIAGGCILCLYWWGISRALLLLNVKPNHETATESIVQPSHSAVSTSTATPSQTDERITALVKEVHQLRDDIIRSPSVDDGAKLLALQNKAAELAKDQETFTKREKEILQHESLSLDSLEKARQQNLQKVEAERQQAELAKQEQEINRQNQQKAFQQEFEAREKRFAAPFIPCTDYATTALYDMLQSISSEPIFSDFPGSRPSIYNSALLKDGRFINGEHIIRVGSHKEWEFHVVTSGNAPTGMPHKYLGFQIRAGTAIMSVGNEYLSMGNWNLANAVLRISCRVGEKELYSERCSFSDYQRPIQEALRQLIQNRYNEFPLKPNTTQPAPTPNAGASPP